MIACTRCGEGVEHIDALFAHWRTTHGEIPVARYQDAPAPYRIFEGRTDGIRREALRVRLAGRVPSMAECHDLARELGYHPKTVREYAQRWAREALHT